jgi:hypothetical protein
MRLRYLLLLVLASAACGGSIGSLDASQHERDMKHCTDNKECASGFCRAGRCG